MLCNYLTYRISSKLSLKQNLLGLTSPLITFDYFFTFDYFLLSITYYLLSITYYLLED